MRDSSSLQNCRKAVAQGGLALRGLTVFALLLAASHVFVQSSLKTVEVVQPYNGSALKIDFTLPVPDRASSIDISANGTAVDKDKVKFTPADKLQNDRCAVLLLVDKTLGNSVGRDAGQRACLNFGDSQISRLNHAKLLYDPRARKFTLTLGEGTNPTCLRGEALLGPTQVQTGDRIQMGDTELLFVALCGETFDWQDNA